MAAKKVAKSGFDPILNLFHKITFWVIYMLQNKRVSQPEMPALIMYTDTKVAAPR